MHQKWSYRILEASMEYTSRILENFTLILGDFVTNHSCQLAKLTVRQFSP